MLFKKLNEAWNDGQQWGDGVAYLLIVKFGRSNMFIRFLVFFPLMTIGNIFFYFPRIWREIKELEIEADEIEEYSEGYQGTYIEVPELNQIAIAVPMPDFMTCPKCDGTGEIMQ